MSRERLIRKIQEYGFAAVELNLYLDNFPHHKEALRDYNHIVRELNRLKAEYEKRYGLLKTLEKILAIILGHGLMNPSHGNWVLRRV